MELAADNGYLERAVSWQEFPEVVRFLQKSGKFIFRGNGKAIALNEYDGFIKIVSDAESGEIIGAHMIGPDVTELLAEIGVVKTLEGTPDEIAWTTHAHPTLSEALMEAALSVEGEAIHGA